MEEEPAVLNRGDEILDLPPGFRFHPSDEEIITHYLTEKVKDSSFTAIAVGEADLNKSEPWDLPCMAKMGEKEWYFFCQRDKKYPTGMRTNRATEAGYWKATGKDKEIYRGRGCLVGMKKTLVFYRGRAPKGEKTNWVMHEFRLEGNFSYYSFPKSSKDEWVVCRVFHKSPAASSSSSSSSYGGVMMKRPSPNEDQLMRLNSFGTSVDDFFDTSLSLPPLMDLPYADSVLNDFAKQPTNSNYNTFHQNHNSAYIGGDGGGGGGVQLYTFPNTAAGYLHRGHECKMEQQQQQQSMVSLSQDTGLSTDNMTAAPEISSRKLEAGPSTSASGMVELESFWDNY